MEPLRSSDPARIADHRLLGRLGAGGMGVVYLARTPRGALVALKVLLAEYAEEPGFKDRFRREVEVARQINNPWAVPLVDADADAEAPWLATAYVPGPSLGEAVTAYGPLAEHGLRVLGARLAEALSEVHRAGLVHRDLKPGNVLIAHDGPRLIDFGIARAPEDTTLTATGVVVGTPGYLSPEQAQGLGADGGIGPASDVFSLGCVLAFAATGRAPFGSGAVDALLYRAVHDPADLDGVPAGLLEVLGRCLEKDPARRPDARELVRELAADSDAQDVETAGTAGTAAASEWLPEPVTRLIAERSAAALALPDIEHTLAPSDAPPGSGPAEPDTSDTSETSESPEPQDAHPAGRRRFLLLAGGVAALGAVGGAAWWAVARDNDSGDDSPAVAASPRRPVHTLALHGDLTGPQRETGKAQERGLRLAVAEFNARADSPFTVKVRVVDDAGDPTASARLATELTDDQAILAVVGPTTDATAQAALAKYDTGLLPVVAVSPGGMSLLIQGFRSFLLGRLPDSVLPLYVSNYLRGTARSRKVGIVLDRPAGNYGSELVSSLSNTLNSVQQPSVPEVVSAMHRDFGSTVDSMLSAGADSVFFAGLPDRGALIAETLRKRAFNGARVSGPALLDGRFLTEAQEAAEGWALVAPVIDATQKPEAQKFAAAYRERWKEAPPRYAAEAYDVTGMLLKALAGLPAKDRTRTKLLEAVRAGKYEGITKAFAFQATGMMVIDGTGGFLWRVEQGDFVYGGPAPLTV
ncbi:bifunctional serine/threonine-protein kinase/ABC transporter substrate-binding protein [Streptomyces sp. WI04-05B]|uniref:bifunctional serine/threonine-protein kinase/ABC transporter substrate-binding protein n=1 Tax=Streptomyces TaxID=1883 RepID=UPI0029BD03EA|nr:MULTISPECIES: bifunctional serine/threonine-protein kinase/ABC transporter substrate-binding protein [unclassified Streptomyces]MDX2543242.1 bifunctional serine/threonine-protein kinase/ABC transporter substrate-binding protein [Streptomyces sp. WI04-05B]MDX2584717.1 bifunctional serine/threonine-protein kinase/ABC transporter substrate-binding protein [Streptomyces sp. WI04-05A]MDX3752776.1 bifunctional serine/threonine-protein kinase/ABC transporter substrate-binding protein [Streptomyces s